jgi:hypothetical protein
MKTHEGERASVLKPRFDLVPFSELRPTGKRAYLVKGLIPRVGLTVFWGPPKSMKSFWAFDLGMHVSLGWEYRGRRVIQGPVVYCAFEGAEGYKARAEAFRQRRLAEGGPSDIPFFLIGAPVDLVADVADLVACIRLALGGMVPVAVFLDTLNRSLRGSESKDEDMAAYVRAADSIREAFACAVIVVHHCGVDDKRPRGHTSLTGAADAQLACKRDGETFTVTVEWLKDGAEGDAISSKLEVVDIGEDEDGDMLTSCVVVPVEGAAAPDRPARKLTDRQKLALSALDRIVVERGVPAPAAFNLPGNVVVVPAELWRDELVRSGAIERDAKNPREDFRRLKTSLLARSLIAMRDDLLWRL